MTKKKSKPKKKATQKEMDLKIKRDAVGKAAITYLKARKEVASAKQDMIEKGTVLAGKMAENKRKSIKIDGEIITRNTVTQEILKVTKSKEK